MEPSEVFLRVFPLALAGALSPFNVTVVIVMLLSKDHPIARPVAFVAGFAMSLVLIGSIALSILSSIYTPPLAPRAYVAISLLGGVLLVLGVRQLIAKTDPDQPPSEWLEKVTQFRIFTAFWVGFFLSMFGLKTLSIYVACIGIITTAQLTPLQTVIETAIVVLVIISTMLIPIVIYIVQPRRGAETLRKMRTWIEHRQHTVAGIILAVAGAALVGYGILGLL